MYVKYTGGGGKSQYPYAYVGLKEFVKLKNIHVNFPNEGPFSHLYDSLDSRIEPNVIEWCLVIKITFVNKNESSSFSGDREARYEALKVCSLRVIR